MNRLSAFWNGLPFVARLLVTASLALVVAGSAMILVSARQEARDARADLAADLAGELENLPGALAEVVVIGDFATLQQILDRHVTRPRVARVGFTDTTGISLLGLDPPRRRLAPEWFARALDFRDVRGEAPVVIGGREYGRVALELTSQGLADRAWIRLLDHLGILLLAIMLDFLGIWLVLRNGLAPLRRLEAGADALARGDLGTRLTPEGSPELRHVIDAFNRMAEASQSAIDAQRRAHADLSRFAEISAHHLMEPSRRLGSYAQRLRARLGGDLEDEEARLALDFLERDASRLRRLVRDIQLYLAADAPRAEIVGQDTGAALAEARSRLARHPRLAGASIESTALPAVTLDRPRLIDLFTILLDNALGHRPPGQPARVRVSGERRTRDGRGFARLRFADDGPGIPAGFRQRVFEIFERLPAPESDGAADAGTGIGLAIARRIVESRDGRIWIEDSDLGGIAVLIELPEPADAPASAILPAIDSSLEPPT